MLKALMEKVVNVQEQINKISEKMRILSKKKKKKKTPGIKNTVIEMKNVLDGLISRLDIADERVSKFKNMTIQISKTEN